MHLDGIYAPDNGSIPANMVGTPIANMKYWMMDNYEVPIISCIVYLMLIFGLQIIMKDREEFKLRGLLIIWNWILAIFSMVGAYFVIPEIIVEVGIHGVHSDMCTGISEFKNPFVMIFCLSKIPEFIDTLFLVLRKRHVRFLHWYHHITVALYCWSAWADNIENGGWFSGMNLIVHTIMYTYFAFAAMEYRFPTWMRESITLLQVLQMVLGLLFVIHNIYYCNFHPFNLTCAFLMYLSYLILFVHFFYESYISPSASQKLSKSQKITGPSDKRGKRD